MKDNGDNTDSFMAVYEHRDDDWWAGGIPDMPGAQGHGETLEEARKMVRMAGHGPLEPREDNSTRDPDIDNALLGLTRTWLPFTTECRAVLGSELHYQAMLYHCLRVHGQIPSGQLGMNVKMWIADVVSEHFQALDEKKNPGFQGGFEPIPDVVIFRPEIRGDYRRRNRENTFRQMLMAIEVKASERYRGRLTAGEIVDDIVKLEALRLEARHRGWEVLPVMVTIDTAPEASERMTANAFHESKAAAREREICLFYVSPSNTSVILPETL